MKKLDKQIETVFRFMIPKEEHKEHIPEYLEDCRSMIRSIYKIGKEQGKLELKREGWHKKGKRCV